MSNNSYDDFKQGIKKDVRGLALNAFGAFGALGLIFTMLFIFGYVFYKDNHFSEIAKIVTALCLLILTGLLFVTRIANAIYTGFLCLMLITFMLLVIVICGGFIYLIFKPMMQDFF